MTAAERESVAALDLRLRASLAAAGSDEASAERNRQSARDAALAIYSCLGWRTLGFTSWPAYLSDVGHNDDLRPPSVEMRRGVVTVLSEEGLTDQAIADMLGVHRSQVTRDLIAMVQSHNPEQPPANRRQSERAERDRRIADYLQSNPRATTREVASALGHGPGTISEAAKRLGHVWAHPHGGQRKPRVVAPSSPPSSDPLWLRAPEFGDLRSIARIIAVMKERNSRTHMAQNVTDALAAGDTEFVNEHARAAAEVAEYAAELLAVFSDADYRADLNRGIPGRTDHNYRPSMRLASVG